VPTLYADEDVSRLLVDELRGSGLSITGARLERRLGRKDDEYLLFAQRSVFVFLTHNLRDFALLHDAWVHWRAEPGFVLPPHEGILILDRADRRTTRDEVVAFLAEDPQLSNETYSWVPAQGWARRVDHEWVPYR
jgi:hypothetical protein